MNEENNRLLERFERDIRQEWAASFRYPGAPKDVIIVGTGPSLKAHNPLTVANSSAHIILLNSAAIWFKDCDLLGFEDGTFHRGEGVSQVITDSSRLFDYHMDPEWVETLVAPYYLTDQWMDEVERKGHYHILPVVFGRDDNPKKPRVFAASCNDFLPSWEITGFFHKGKTVLFAALELAWRLRPDRVIVIGCDLDYSGPQTHFDKSMKHLNPLFDYDRDCRELMELFANQLRSFAIEPFYGSPGGKIHCFNRTPLEELFR